MTGEIRRIGDDMNKGLARHHRDLRVILNEPDHIAFLADPVGLNDFALLEQYRFTAQLQSYFQTADIVQHPVVCPHNDDIRSG